MRKLQAQFKTFWMSLSLTRKITVGGVIVLIIAGISSLFVFRQSDPYEYLFVDVAPEDTPSILAEFKRANFADYQIDGKGIKVPTAEVAKLRMQLAQEGLPSHGIVGWEKFDTQDFTRTEFEQNIHKMRARDSKFGLQINRRSQT